MASGQNDGQFVQRGHPFLKMLEVLRPIANLPSPPGDVKNRILLIPVRDNRCSGHGHYSGHVRTRRADLHGDTAPPRRTQQRRYLASPPLTIKGPVLGGRYHVPDSSTAALPRFRWSFLSNSLFDF